MESEHRSGNRNAAHRDHRREFAHSSDFSALSPMAHRLQLGADETEDGIGATTSGRGGMKVMRTMARFLLASVMVLESLPAVAHDRSPGEQASEDSQPTMQFAMRAGDYVRLHPVDGERVTGRVESVDGDIISLDGKSFDLSRGGVEQIELRIDDSLANGALIGGGIAAGYVGVSCAAGGGCGSDSVVWVATAILVAAGAGLGAYIDSLRHGYKTIYPAPASETTWSIVPIIDGDTKAVVFSLSF
jgi:hypothetical protein